MNERVEGSGASQLVQLIRQLGYNTDVTVEWATVVAAPPDLKIQIDHMPAVLEKDDVLVVEQLTKHKKKIKLSGGKATLSGGTIGGSTDAIPGHSHKVTDLSLSDASLEIAEAEIEYDHELKKDDRVIVLGIHHGQTYIILDRVVMK
ncbi:DUF2577 family protein [Ectobacillus ponti]|uniref:DUF2577 domain-containing protein n=1 Tax=Ectobacillus ponti TaxID=2961894 RepID=A0AA42BU08_9BACI|nr:DUF2577 family protein [Ectobacillus ponti]MCP8970048.1 DUF2577 domain-containing protein [Ectobacillus ponti]